MFFHSTKINPSSIICQSQTAPLFNVHTSLADSIPLVHSTLRTQPSPIRTWKLRACNSRGRWWNKASVSARRFSLQNSSWSELSFPLTGNCASWLHRYSDSHQGQDGRSDRHRQATQFVSTQLPETQQISPQTHPTTEVNAQILQAQ